MTTQTTKPSDRDALLAIANMRIDENTNHAQLAALMIAIARAQTGKE